MQVSGSIVNGSGYINHNERKFTRGNVDRERTKDNIQIMDETEEQAYKNLFADTIEEYNATQKRADRKKTVEGYHEEITNNKHKKGAEKPFYEVIIQIGDKETCHCVDNPKEAERAKQALLKYAETWNERNPNLKMFNATLHMDEATPHLHIDYIPVATGYKQGLKVRNSLSKALEKQGLVSTKQQHDNASMKWLEQERTALKEIGKEYDFQIVEQGISREHLSVADFKKVQDKLNRELEKQKIVELKPTKVFNTRILSKEDYETVQKTNDIIAKKELVLDEMTNRVSEQRALLAEVLRKQNEREKKELKQIEADKQRIESDREEIQRQRAEVTSLYNEQLHINKSLEYYKAETDKWGNQFNKANSDYWNLKDNFDAKIQEHTKKVKTALQGKYEPQIRELKNSLAESNEIIWDMAKTSEQMRSVPSIEKKLSPDAILAYKSLENVGYRRLEKMRYNKPLNLDHTPMQRSVSAEFKVLKRKQMELERSKDKGKSKGMEM